MGENQSLSDWVPYEGAQVWYCKLGEKFYEWEVIGPSIESNILLFCWRDMLTNYLYIYVHSLTLSSSLVRKTSFCSGQPLMHRFITHQSTQNKWLLSAQSWMECLYQQLPSPQGQEHCERRGRKSMRAGIQEREMWNPDFWIWSIHCTQTHSMRCPGTSNSQFQHG